MRMIRHQSRSEASPDLDRGAPPIPVDPGIRPITSAVVSIVTRVALALLLILVLFPAALVAAGP
jgi:hypothetical protein